MRRAPSVTRDLGPIITPDHEIDHSVRAEGAGLRVSPITGLITRSGRSQSQAQSRDQIRSQSPITEITDRRITIAITITSPSRDQRPITVAGHRDH